MASRVERKEAARAARLAAEAEERRATARRRNLSRLGAVVAVAAIAVVVAVVVSSGGNGGTKAAGGTTRAASSQVASLFRGLPQNGTTLGDPKAAHTLVEFADLQCPICQEYTLNVLPSVLRDYVRTGKVRLDLKLRTFIGPDSMKAAKVAAAAAQQSRIWPFADLFYRNQGEENSGYVTQDFLKKIADGTPGLNASKALAQAGSPASQKLISRDESLATSLGSNSTPDFFLRTGSGGPLRPVSPSALTPGAFAEALNQALGTKA